VGCCAFEVTAGQPLPAAVPVGSPVANTRLYVLDEWLDPVPAGTAGELYVAGAQLARGYLGRAALTAERFTACPFGAEGGAGAAGQRMYRTGDLARWRPDGMLEFCGRADDQIKIRGYRIEPAEVAAVLAAHPRVARAAVIAREDTPGDKRLTGYVTPADNDADDAGDPAPVLAAAVRAHAAARLPDHMVPATVIVLEAFPLTPAGKLDKAALPPPQPTASTTGRAPATVTEEIVCAAFAAVLRAPTVGPDDNFFALGGHSLLAVALAERLREQGLQVPVAALFEAPTPGQLAAVAGPVTVIVPPNLIPDGAPRITPEMLPLVNLTQEQIDRLATDVEGGAANIADIYPLAPLQQGMFFHHLMAGPGAEDVYLSSFVLRMRSRQQLAEFTAALEQVIARHDVFRTSVAWAGLAEPAQVVWRQAPLPVTEITLEAAADAPPGTDPPGTAIAALRALAPQWIDLSRAPLLRLTTAAEPGTDQHLALLQIHHLVQDETGFEILLTEIAALLAGQADRLPEPLKFRDFVAQARLASTPHEHERYFANLLGDVTEPTAPYGLADIYQAGESRSARQMLDAGLAGRLRDQARSRGVSVATIVHLAWARTLAAVSGRDDVVFGTVLVGRMNAGSGADRIPGLYMNTLPVRVAVAVAATGVADALTAVRSQLAALLAHEHAPLVLAQQASGIPAHLPLFTTLLNCRHGRPRDTGTPGTQSNDTGIKIVAASADRSNYPLTVSFDDLGTAFGLSIDAARPADPRQLGALLSTCLDNLVTALDTAPDTPLPKVQVLSPPERAQLLTAWNTTNTTNAPAAPPQTVPELFEQQTARTPDAVAVVCGHTRVSYAQLNTRANRLARALKQQCAGREPVVAVLADRSPELVVALLAVLKAGAVYLPVHPGTPPERVAWMFADANVQVLLADRDQDQDRDRPGQLPWLPIANGDQAGDGADLAVSRHPDQLAYVMYTSGSTGTPKGVVIRHRDVAAFAADRSWAGGAHRRVLMHSAMAFDASTYELWVPLLSGGTMVVEPAELEVDGLRRVIAREQVSALFLTTSLFNLVAAECPATFTRVQVLLMGGEPASAAAMRQVLAACPRIVLGNGYGPTETTTFATCSFVADPDQVQDVPPIGRPLDNTRVFVLDSWLAPVPPGVPGDLYIAGAGLARGYAGRPDLTAERFVACPFGPPGERMYRTGDRASWTNASPHPTTPGRHPAAELVFAGRADDQVKIRGFRVEPAEIEAVLAGHPAVAQAVVVVREPAPGDRRLAAYVVAAPDGDELAETIRTYAAQRLPDYMVPTVTLLAELPLTPNGKLDRAALPAPDPTGAGEGNTLRWVVQLEQTLCETFAEVLGLDQVGVDDEFFRLGGHSLLAVRLVERLRTKGVSISVRDLIAAPTVRGVMARMSLSSVQDSLSPLLPIRATGDGPIMFCVHPAGGLSWGYMPLARHVPENWRLYGLQARALDGTTEFPGSIRDIAADYVELIKTVQPAGPYLLLGYSFGGLVVHEMAVQLQEAGEEAAIIVGDAYPQRPSSGEPAEELQARTIDLMRTEAGNILGAISEEELLLLADIFYKSAVLAQTAEFRRFHGDMLLLVALAGRSDSATYTEPWDPYVSGQITEVRLPCPHSELLHPEMLREAWSAISAWLEFRKIL
jgi:amino acid adenylation domain-containing protein